LDTVAAMKKLKIGEIVRLNLPQIFDHCAQHDPDEIVKLMDKDYCAETFRLSWAMLKTPAEAELIKSETGYSRYWTKTHTLLDHELRVTSEWVPKRHLPAFLRYLVDQGLTPLGVSAEDVDAEISKLTAPKKTTASPGGARYRKTPIGVAQNAVVRNILGCVGQEAFTEKDWLAVKASFGHACVYCGSRRQLVMDHAVPISLEALGEHRLGNLVPACHSCNSDKGETSFEVYLQAKEALDPEPDGAVRLEAIRAHMSRHGYVPLKDALPVEEVQSVRAALVRARSEIAAAAAGAIEAINAKR